MKYSLEFYCTSSDSHTKYGWTPKRGDPHVDRLINGQPYWPELGSRTITQKTLILADWTGRFWSLEKTEQVKTVLAQLIAEEFIIYLWQKGRVTPLCIDKLSSLDIRCAMSLTPTQAIVEAAITQHKLTVDNIQVIDDYWVEHLLSGSEVLRPRVLRSRELAMLPAQMLDDVINISNAARPKLSKIIHDEFSESANNFVRLLQQKHPNIGIDADYTILKLSGNVNASHSNELFLNGLTIKLDREQLGKIQTIQLVGASAQNLGAILQDTTKLQTLEWKRSESWSDHLEFHSLSLTALESLNLGSSGIPVVCSCLIQLNCA